MPFDIDKFNETFGHYDRYELTSMMTDFAMSDEESTDEFEVYRAIIATQEFNSNYLFLDEKTLQNIAAQSNRDMAGNDIPIFPNHDRYDFQIGTMLSGTYQKSKKRVEGTFSIIKDSETEVLRNRINNKVVRDVSPTIKGEIECDICGDGTKMWKYGGCKNGHYLGETIPIDGKDRIVTGTFKDANLVEVSVVSMGAFPGATIFSENEELLREALAEGVINEKALDSIEYNFSVDLSGVRRTTIPNGGNPMPNPEPEPNPEPSPEPEPNPEPGGNPMPNPTDTDTKLLNDQIADYKQEIADKDKQIAKYQEQVSTMISAEDRQKIENDLTETKAKLIETEGKLGAAEVIVTQYEACVDHVRTQAIEFFAKVRGVDIDNTTDSLFPSRKKALEDSDSLTYLLGALEQYQNSYYSSVTEFGGQTKRETTRTLETQINPNHFDI